MNRTERLVFALQRQLVAPAAAETVAHQLTWPGQQQSAGGSYGPQPPFKAVPMDNSLVYLGEVGAARLITEKGCPRWLLFCVCSNTSPVPCNALLLHVCLLQTCVFDVTLSNQGAPVAALTIKVECSVEGGSTSVLYDNSQSPLQQLPFNAQEQLRVQTDVKEQGLITIVASAVFTGTPADSLECARLALR